MDKTNQPTNLMKNQKPMNHLKLAFEDFYLNESSKNEDNKLSFGITDKDQNDIKLNQQVLNKSDDPKKVIEKRKLKEPDETDADKLIKKRAKVADKLMIQKGKKVVDKLKKPNQKDSDKLKEPDQTDADKLIKKRAKVDDKLKELDQKVVDKLKKSNQKDADKLMIQKGKKLVDKLKKKDVEAITVDESVKSKPNLKPSNKHLKCEDKATNEYDQTKAWCFCPNPSKNIAEMIRCDNCREWFHKECLNFVTGQMFINPKQNNKWFCCCHCEKNYETTPENVKF